ncbi:SMP-30/gluconolactonase/LRE family protein [Novosphingobium sp. B 225]|uniref:SMP-30/gluconolactonase/LRE family protein n=1 Tax=Novosphingobium sp. B 225 TaxID=1961849 RepID=UPI000B4AAC30|nr:SMP-30/gluconolactonase/LRE family protein [Novosphingobium sp. B 225]
MKHTPTLFAEGYLFPETPRWHAGRGEFIVTDIDRGQVFAVSTDGQRRQVYQGPDWVSGTAFESDTTLLVTNARSRSLVRVHLDQPDAAPEMIASLAEIAPFGINDMIRTDAGVCFIDTVSFDFVAYARGEIAAQPSVLARVDADGRVSVATKDLNFPNGMVITPDGKRLLVADSLDQCIHAFALSADGTLGERTCFAALPGEMPDGMCLDASGAVWVAVHGRVLRVAEGGAVLDEVDMGSTLGTAVALGGADGRTLLITASDSYDRSVMAGNPTGRLFTVHVDVPGAGLPSVY